MMKKCKLTVLKTTFQEDLAKEYGIPHLGKCPLMEEGEVFYADYAKPEGFCDEAWKERFINMSLRWRMVLMIGILMIGLIRKNTKALPFAPAMTD